MKRSGNNRVMIPRGCKRTYEQRSPFRRACMVLWMRRRCALNHVIWRKNKPRMKRGVICAPAQRRGAADMGKVGCWYEAEPVPPRQQATRQQTVTERDQLCQRATNIHYYCDLTDAQAFGS